MGRLKTIAVIVDPDTIPNLLDCLVQQDYKNFEVLIVDACHSPDIERYAGWYQKQLNLRRIRLIICALYSYAILAKIIN